jgi:hypothetical protein
MFIELSLSVSEIDFGAGEKFFDSYQVRERGLDSVEMLTEAYQLGIHPSGQYEYHSDGGHESGKGHQRQVVVGSFHECVDQGFEGHGVLLKG